MNAVSPLRSFSLADARRPLRRDLDPTTVQMVVRIWDVEHGACAMIYPTYNGVPGRIAMVDCGCTDDWHPSIHLRYGWNRTALDYLFIQNADQDHLSDLNGFSDEGVEIAALYRSDVSSIALRTIKLLESGDTSSQFDRFASMCDSYLAPVPHPFNTSMGGITYRAFHNPFPKFVDTNNLSLVLFFKFCGFKILFGGDLHREGWLALLEDSAFRSELSCTDILVASHHGRDNGFCRELFDYCVPTAVVMSDKAIVHDTQQSARDYRSIVHPHMNGISVNGRRRYVLTTRNDGHITFVAGQDGTYSTTVGRW